ncbi:glutamine--fructose-6-phosphate transaminase (isomerizing) [Candidatus Nomurabacteria bacterium]|nr:glutamine--fructose-6-phosphate transaminase (isomerizing) [Candidatus Nomurabacteria bacterium]
MCGIIGYIGKRQAFPVIIKGLQMLEYRGYDSAGVALVENNMKVFKKKGKVAELLKLAEVSDTKGTIGIGHTRWATHGAPDDKNAHPHLSQSGKLAVIHNGIIENYIVLKQALMKEGHTFKSDTDTEVLIHLIEAVKEKDNLSLLEAVREALTQVIGAYAIIVMDEKDTDTLIVARRGSPLVLGIGEEEFFIASDASPIVEYTKSVVYLEDNQIAIVKRNGEYNISSIAGVPHTPFIEKLTMEAEALEKNGYDHYMQKEIFEQSHSIADALRGHILPDRSVHLRGLEEISEAMNIARRIIIVACGTSWISGLVGEYLIESLARMPVEVEYASEFRYRKPILNKHDIVIAISQSGETADTLAALQLAKEFGAVTYGICNVVGSSIARMTDAGSYIHVGPEIGVASTKAFTGQVVILSLLALLLAKKRETLSEEEYNKLVDSLENIGDSVDKVLKEEKKIKEIAEILKNKENALFLGRGILFPVALEGALKLKEISYIHAEGYPAAEMKHGPIALVEKDFPVITIATNESLIEKVISNVQEVKARGALTIGLVREGNAEDMKNIFDHIIEIPNVPDEWMPILSVLPLQLLAYHTAIPRGADVDKPRNLAKSVTVE